MLHKVISKLAKNLVILFIFFLYLELSLQIASLIQNKILNSRISRQEDKRNGQINILCVGDSFTQGVGASDIEYSYPMQLQKYLNKNSHYNWRVFNSGVAGTNSSELVNFIPRLIDRYSPAYLCILIGMNDSWNLNLRNEAFFPSEPYPIIKKKSGLISWKLRFRTLRLFRMLLKYFQDIRLSKSSSPNKNIISKKTENIKDLFESGKKLLSENRPQEAIEVFTKVITMAPDNLDARIQLAYSLVAQKRSAEAIQYAHSVRESISGKSLIQHIYLAWFFMFVGEFNHAYNEVEEYRKHFPADLGMIYEALANIAFETFDYNAAEYYFKKVIKDYPQKTFSYRTLARVYSLKDNKLDDALKLLIQAHLIDRNTDQTKLYLSIVHSSSPFTLEHFIKILEKFENEVNVDLTIHNELRLLCQTMIKRIGGDDVLRKNLAIISALCLQHKAVPLFITYPGPMHSSVSKVIRDFCLQRNKLMVDSEDIFKDLLVENKFEKYFVLDSHLNNEGYRILGEEVGKVIIARTSNENLK